MSTCSPNLTQSFTDCEIITFEIDKKVLTTKF
jgi:hypothetical protein